MKEEEVEALLREYLRSRDPMVQARLSAWFGPMVRRIASQFRGQGEPLEDLVQVGYLGLLQALNRYDPERGVPFKTYAAALVAGEIRHYLRDHGRLIRLPRWLGAVLREVDRAVDAFWTTHSRAPTVEELARSLNVTPEGVDRILRLRAMRTPIPLEPEEIQRLRASLRHQWYESFQLPIEDRITVLAALERLREVERKVIYALFYLDLTETETARWLQMSQRRISRILHRALDRLSALVRSEMPSEDKS
ncbi:MAG: sigma-70 family RNA polymerase sigma factor [Armatimonadetes bacterium]|nr:sigma-70 family RNA polymerase sigma factor [Armatimonadota bacterium]MDW8152996.1 sigma-70 family RNA polymerase sigma factor [Armatimonadota bacterium]